MPRGRKPRDAKKDAQAFEVDRQEALKVFEKKKTVLPKDVIDRYEIKPVSRLSLLGGMSVRNFVGENTYEDAIKDAYAWRDTVNAENGHIIELVAYFPQEHAGKTIIVSYNYKVKQKE